MAVFPKPSNIQIHITSRFQICLLKTVTAFIPANSIWCNFIVGQNELYVAWAGITAVKVSDVVVWSSWGRDVMIAMDALLERGRFERDHYPGLHVLDERHWKQQIIILTLKLTLHAVLEHKSNVKLLIYTVKTIYFHTCNYYYFFAADQNI